jgi:hypothetical protein
LPRKEDIEKFKEILNSLGGEPEIMARRSQTIEDVMPPDEALPEGLSEQLSFGAAPTGSTPGISLDGSSGQPASETLSEQTPEGGPDFGLDLTSLEDLDVGPGAALTEIDAEQTASEQASETGLPATTEEGGLDFGSLFGEEATPHIEELTPPAPEAPGGSQPEETAPEEFSLPESESAALQSDLSQMEVLPEEIGEPLAPSEEAETPAAGLSEQEALLAGGPPGENLSEEALAGIELPNLEDLSLTEPLAGAGEEEPLPGLAQEEALARGAQPALEEGPQMDGLTAPPTEAPAEQPAETPFEMPGELPSTPNVEPSLEGLAETTTEGLQEPTAADEGLANLNLEEFSFTEPTGQFAVTKEPAEEAAPELPPQAARPTRGPAKPSQEAASIPELGGTEQEITLTREQFSRLKRTLESLPRNLKIAVQDVIGQGKATGASLSRLISLLVAGATAQQIVTVVTRITGKRITIPAGYEKKTGVAFEAEQRSFAYALRENIYPLLRLFALTVLAAALIGFLGYRLVYRPLAAAMNYRVGYSHILGDRFTLANESFDKARSLQRMKKWYYRYAEAFADRHQYVLAEQKYDLLLRDFPGDKKGILDYAGMESTALVDYAKADSLLKILLDRNPLDFDALLAAGDNNLEWATAAKDQKDSLRFQAARFDYATLIDRYGARDDLLFRMLRWFIRTNNPQEIERLRLYFASRPDIRVNPDVYAELGGYLVDHRQLDYAKDVLLKADQADSRLAEIHYNLARYYRITDQPQDELTALKVTLLRLSPTDPLSPKRIAMEIDTHTRLGEVEDARGQYIDGQKELTTAIAKVEENQANKLIPAGSIFGRPYADLGDLNYYVIGDLDTARTLYQKAIENGYFDPSLDYKIGFTLYAGKDYAGALASFSKAEDEWGFARDRDAPPPLVLSGTAPVDYGGSVPPNLLFAIGNCFFQRGDYFAAQGYYLRLRDGLVARRAALGMLAPEEKPEQRALLEIFVKVDNNLGVVMDRLAARTGDRNKRSEGLVYLTDASQIADSLTRVPGAPTPAAGAKNLPYLNQRGILYPVAGFVPQISSDIPKDLGTLSW